MEKPSECSQRFRDGLEQYIKPREQVSYIRRILALHLESNSQDGLIRRPLSLADGGQPNLELANKRGVHHEYSEALAANSAARKDFQHAVGAEATQPKPRRPSPSDTPNHLQEQVALLRLQRKRQRLLLVKKYLDDLADDPAASSTFLDPAQMFENIIPLPSMPNDIVGSLAAAQSPSAPDLVTQAANLEKVVLRAKVTLKQEEQLLLQARKNAESIPEVVSNGARLEALTATRNELITWIESELSNAATDEQTDQVEAGGKTKQESIVQSSIDAKLAQIADKYARYISSRKLLLETVTQDQEISIAPVLKPHEVETGGQHQSSPTNYLLTPYIQQLLVLSRHQKAMISQKSHLGSALSKQTKETCQSLGHLAEESQLLPVYPMKDSLRRRSGLQDELTGRGSGRPDLARRIKPWVFAADCAKIASLESVAESVERGQISLEATMQSLEDINQLHGGTAMQNMKDDAVNADETDDDVWLTGAETAKEDGARKHTERKAAKVPGDAWSDLHGNLGLIGQDDVC